MKIREEIPSYLTVLMRKSSITKIVESVAFILLVFGLYLNFGYNNSTFKISVILGAILTLGLSPVIYKTIVKPKYTLTNSHLIIEKLDSKKEVPIAKIKHSYDLRMFYILDGKKTALTVSDDFLEDLNKEIDKNKEKSK